MSESSEVSYGTLDLMVLKTVRLEQKGWITSEIETHLDLLTDGPSVRA